MKDLQSLYNQILEAKKCDADLLPPVIIGLSAALITYLMMNRVGITLSPDGWAYWEGSVSMLSGKGYRYFGGEQITSFPPLFSLYLTLTQLLFGVTGTVLIGSLASLSALTVFTWSLLLSKLVRGQRYRRYTFWVGTTYIASFICAYYTLLLSETLSLALLGLLLITILDDSDYTAPEKAHTTHVAPTTFALAMLMLTRNSSLAFVPAIFVIILVRKGIRPSLAVVALSMAPWLVLRRYVAQAAAHPVSFGGNYSSSQYIIQLCRDLALRFDPERPWVGTLLLLLVVLCICIYLVRTHRRTKTMGSIEGLCVFLGIAVICLYGLFNLTWIHDMLAGRFLWHFPVILVVILAAITARGAQEKMLSFLMCVLLLLVCTIQVAGTGSQLVQSQIGDTRANVAGATTIEAGYYSRPPSAKGTLILVSPPDYPWLHRSSKKTLQP
jgi:hypothetical protein